MESEACADHAPTRHSIRDRALIGQAKALVMQRRNCDEQTAYRLLQKTAMNRRMKLVDVARRLMAVANIDLDRPAVG